MVAEKDTNGAFSRGHIFKERKDEHTHFIQVGLKRDQSFNPIIAEKVLLWPHVDWKMKFWGLLEIDVSERGKSRV